MQHLFLCYKDSVLRRSIEIAPRSGRSLGRKFGYESCELDALDRRVISQLIADKIYSYRDVAAWNNAVQREDEIAIRKRGR